MTGSSRGVSRERKTIRLDRTQRGSSPSVHWATTFPSWRTVAGDEIAKVTMPKVNCRSNCPTLICVVNSPTTAERSRSPGIGRSWHAPDLQFRPWALRVWFQQATDAWTCADRHPRWVPNRVPTRSHSLPWPTCHHAWPAGSSRKVAARFVDGDKVSGAQPSPSLTGRAQRPGGSLGVGGLTLCLPTY